MLVALVMKTDDIDYNANDDLIMVLFMIMTTTVMMIMLCDDVVDGVDCNH